MGPSIRPRNHERVPCQVEARAAPHAIIPYGCLAARIRWAAAPNAVTALSASPASNLMVVWTRHYSGEGFFLESYGPLLLNPGAAMKVE